MSANDWLDLLGAELPADALDDLGPEERTALLDLARVAAHRSHRSAAPISTYLVGLAYAGLSRSDRLARIRGLVARLDTADA